MSQESTTQADLTGILAEIASVAGEEAALALSQKLGGSSVHVARRPGEDSFLVRAVGMDAARAISGLYGGENILVPLANSARARLRERLIHKLIGEGVSINEVARRLGVTNRTVQRANRKLKAGARRAGIQYGESLAPPKGRLSENDSGAGPRIGRNAMPLQDSAEPCQRLRGSGHFPLAKNE